MSRLTVIVVGHSKTGKSTVATIIANALREQGFSVVHADQDNGFQPFPRHMLEPRATALLEKKTEISVREVSA